MYFGSSLTLIFCLFNFKLLFLKSFFIIGLSTSVNAYFKNHHCLAA